MEFFIVVEGDERTGYSAYVPSLEGVYATGRTERVVRSRISSGIAYHIAKLREAGQPVPTPPARVIQIDVAV